jgi:hypothetical protein
MAYKHISTLLALASPILVSACSKDSTKPGTDSGPVANADVAVTNPPDSAPVVKCFSGTDDLIADFKTDNGLNPADGRQGGFYLYDDNSIKGTFDPPLVTGQAYPIDTQNGNDACSGPGSFHTKAANWGVWGAALGVDFEPKNSSGFKGSYDASKYKGISFWAKSGAPLSHVQFSIKDIYSDGDASFDGTDAADAGWTQCVYVANNAQNCSPFLVKFGEDAAYFPNYQTYKIDTTWKRFDVYFADTRQDQYNKGFHAAADAVNQSNLDTAHLTGMAIQVNADFSTNPPTANDFEIWIDDVYFIK